MLTESDVARFDSIMAAVTARREARGFMIPDRDEDKIAEILRQSEIRAEEEHRLWLESMDQFASAVKYQPPVGSSDESKEFPQLDRYRYFEAE